MDRRKKLAYNKLQENRAKDVSARGPKPITQFSWSAPYRLKGLAIGLALSALYSYFVMHGWHLILIVPATIFGYFMGWVVGYLLYNKRMR